jgi:hypothetical protein
MFIKFFYDEINITHRECNVAIMAAVFRTTSNGVWVAEFNKVHLLVADLKPGAWVLQVRASNAL